MKILHLANHCHEIGNGIMNVAVDLSCRQAESGHAVTFASAGGSYVPLIERHGVRHLQLKQHWRRFLQLPAAARGLRALLHEVRPDVVHAHMMTGAVLAFAVRGTARWALVTTVHNEWQRSAIAMRVGDRVIAVSDAVAERMAQRGIPRERIDVVRNGPLNTPRRPPAAKADVALGAPSILTVAGLYERKGIGELISAFERVAPYHPRATLTIVGDGPDRARFEARARASRYDARIKFVGFVADPRPYFRAADIFVLASRSEPFGLVLAEAREAGCACIGTRVGGIPEVLEAGRAGLLVPPEDPEALASALATLLQDPAAMVRWRGAAARGLEWLDIARTAEQTVEVYRRAIDGRSLRKGLAPRRPDTRPFAVARPAETEAVRR